MPHHNSQNSPSKTAAATASSVINTMPLYNAVSALVTEFIGRTLIERNFFQQQAIPSTTLFFMANDLIRTLNPPQHTSINWLTEASISYKYAKLGVKWLFGRELTNGERAFIERGEERGFLTPEEYAYEAKDKDILEAGIRGLSYTLLLPNVLSSIGYAASHSWRDHLPAVAGYTAAAIAGPALLAKAVELTMSRSQLTPHQQALVKPWLNTVGRLALGFMPKAHADEHGVGYASPSLQGQWTYYQERQIISQTGDQQSIEIQQVGELSNGETQGTADIKMTRLVSVNQLTEKMLRVTVETNSGQRVPVEVYLRQDKYANYWTINSPDKVLAQQWTGWLEEKLGVPATPTPSQTANIANVLQADDHQFLPSKTNQLTSLQQAACLAAGAGALFAPEPITRSISLMAAISACQPFKVSASDNINKVEALLSKRDNRQWALNRLERDKFINEVWQEILPNGFSLIPLLDNKLNDRQIDKINKDIALQARLMGDLLSEEIRAEAGSFKANGYRLNTKLVDVLKKIRANPRFEQPEHQAIIQNIMIDMVLERQTAFAKKFKDLFNIANVQDARITTLEVKMQNLEQARSTIQTDINAIYQGIRTNQVMSNERFDALAAKIDSVETGLQQEIKNLNVRIDLNEEQINQIRDFLVKQDIASLTQAFTFNKQIRELQQQYYKELNRENRDHTVLAQTKQQIIDKVADLQFTQAFFNYAVDSVNLVGLLGQLFHSEKLAKLSNIAGAFVSIGSGFAMLGGTLIAATPLSPYVVILDGVATLLNLDNNDMIQEIMDAVRQMAIVVVQEVLDLREENRKLHGIIQKVLIEGHAQLHEHLQHLGLMLHTMNADNKKQFEEVKQYLSVIEGNLITLQEQQYGTQDLIYQLASENSKFEFHRIKNEVMNSLLVPHTATMSVQIINKHAEALKNWAVDYAGTLRALSGFELSPNSHEAKIARTLAAQIRSESALGQLGLAFVIKHFANHAAHHLALSVTRPVPNPIIWAEASDLLLGLFYHNANNPNYPLNQETLNFYIEPLTHQGRALHKFIAQLQTPQALSRLFDRYKESITQAETQVRQFLLAAKLRYENECFDANTLIQGLQTYQVTQAKTDAAVLLQAAEKYDAEQLAEYEGKSQIAFSHADAIANCISFLSNNARDGYDDVLSFFDTRVIDYCTTIMSELHGNPGLKTKLNTVIPDDKLNYFQHLASQELDKAHKLPNALNSERYKPHNYYLRYKLPNDLYSKGYKFESLNEMMKCYANNITKWFESTRPQALAPFYKQTLTAAAETFTQASKTLQQHLQAAPLSDTAERVLAIHAEYQRIKAALLNLKQLAMDAPPALQPIAEKFLDNLHKQLAEVNSKLKYEPQQFSLSVPHSTRSPVAQIMPERCSVPQPFTTYLLINPAFQAKVKSYYQKHFAGLDTSLSKALSQLDEHQRFLYYYLAFAFTPELAQTIVGELPRVDSLQAALTPAADSSLSHCQDLMSGAWKADNLRQVKAKLLRLTHPQEPEACPRYFHDLFLSRVKPKYAQEDVKQHTTSQQTEQPQAADYQPYSRYCENYFQTRVNATLTSLSIFSREVRNSKPATQSLAVQLHPIYQTTCQIMQSVLTDLKSASMDEDIFASLDKKYRVGLNNLLKLQKQKVNDCSQTSRLANLCTQEKLKQRYEQNRKNNASLEKIHANLSKDQPYKAEIKNALTALSAALKQEQQALEGLLPTAEANTPDTKQAFSV